MKYKVLCVVLADFLLHVESFIAIENNFDVEQANTRNLALFKHTKLTHTFSESIQVTLTRNSQPSSLPAAATAKLINYDFENQHESSTSFRFVPMRMPVVQMKIIFITPT
jgi:hypothetical protein